MVSIIEELAKFGIKQKDIAAQLGISTAAISKWKKNGQIPRDWEGKIRIKYANQLVQPVNLQSLIPDQNVRDQWIKLIEMESPGELEDLVDALSGDGHTVSKRDLQAQLGIISGELTDARSDDNTMIQLTADLLSAGFSVKHLLKATLDDYSGVPELGPTSPELLLFREVLKRFFIIRQWTELFIPLAPTSRPLIEATKQLNDVTTKIAVFSAIYEKYRDEKDMRGHVLSKAGMGIPLRYTERNEIAVFTAIKSFTACIQMLKLDYVSIDLLALRKFDFRSLTLDLADRYFPTAPNEVSDYQFMTHAERILFEKLDKILDLLSVIAIDRSPEIARPNNPIT